MPLTVDRQDELVQDVVGIRNRIAVGRGGDSIAVGIVLVCDAQGRIDIVRERHQPIGVGIVSIDPIHLLGRIRRIDPVLRQAISDLVVGVSKVAAVAVLDLHKPIHPIVRIQGGFRHGAVDLLMDLSLRLAVSSRVVGIDKARDQFASRCGGPCHGAIRRSSAWKLTIDNVRSPIRLVI